jgi:recombinational DNA repair protein RecR
MFNTLAVFQPYSDIVHVVVVGYIADRINQSIINNFHGSYHILEHTLKTTEFNQILILTWDRYNNVLVLNQLI